MFSSSKLRDLRNCFGPTDWQLRGRVWDFAQGGPVTWRGSFCGLRIGRDLFWCRLKDGFGVTGLDSLVISWVDCMVFWNQVPKACVGD